MSDRPRSTPTDIPSTFDDFFRVQHAPVVRALALALGDAELAADAADEGFTRALAKWGRVSGFDSPGGWVYRVGLNWATSRRRRSRRETLVEHPIGDDRSHSEAPTTDPTVSDALRRLPLEQRTVVVARYYLDLSEAETASALGLRPGTVKSRLHRALTRLADDPGVLSTRPPTTRSHNEETDPS